MKKSIGRKTNYRYGAYRKKKLSRRKKILLTVFLILSAGWLLFVLYSVYKTGTAYPTGELLDGHATFRFLDVGQGDCTLVTWQGDAVLIDTGTTESGAAAAESVRLYAPVVDYLIITHPHEDHMGGAADVLEEVQVNHLVLPAAESGDWFYTRTMKLAEEKRIPVLRVADGAEFDAGCLHVEIFDPLDLPLEDLNDASLITRIDADGVSLLVAGDAELPAERHALGLRDPDLDCDILKVGHHGSNSSTSAEFLAAVTPKVSVISVGRNNDYGHPHWAVLERLVLFGSEIHRTDREGTVVIRGGWDSDS